MKTILLSNFVGLSKKYLPVLVILGCLLSAIILQSRSFIIGYFVAGLFIFLYYRNFRLNRKGLLTCVCAIFLLITFLSLFTKSDSSLGRIFIYKISLKILSDHFWSGVGWGKFGWAYLNYQYDYFKSGQYTVKELLLADNTKHAFNDYLQFWIENGILGLCIELVCVIFIVFMTVRIFKKKLVHAPLVQVVLTQVVALMIAASFTHVFERINFQILFLISCTILLQYAFFQKVRLTILCLTLLISCLIVYGWNYSGYITNYTAYEKLQDANELYKSGFVTESLKSYDSLLPILAGDIDFLKDYSRVLSTAGKFIKQEKILEKIVTQDNANVFYLTLANCYQKNGKIKLAEQAYLRAVYTVPNRFVPRERLLEFYVETKQNEKAISIGQSILSLPVKIPSSVVNHVKANTNEILKHLIDNRPNLTTK